MRAQLTDDDLIRFWHEDALAGQIAHREGISRTSLIAGWRRLKLQGLLPQGGERPRNARLYRDREPGVGDAPPGEFRATVGPDRLLERLKRGQR